MYISVVCVWCVCLCVCIDISERIGNCTAVLPPQTNLQERVILIEWHKTIAPLHDPILQATPMYVNWGI